MFRIFNKYYLRRTYLDYFIIFLNYYLNLLLQNLTFLEYSENIMCSQDKWLLYFFRFNFRLFLFSQRLNFTGFHQSCQDGVFSSVQCSVFPVSFDMLCQLRFSQFSFVTVLCHNKTPSLVVKIACSEFRIPALFLFILICIFEDN